MVMFVVVPGNESSAVRERIVVTAKAIGKLGSVLHGLKLALGKGIIVRDMGAAVTLGDAQGGQQLGHGMGRHGRSSIAVDGQLVLGNVLLDECLPNQALRQIGTLAMGEHPADDVTAEDVENHVEVEIGPFFWAQELGDVP